MQYHHGMARRAAMLGLVTLACGGLGCADEDDGESATACADTAQVLAMPHPGWHNDGTRLAPPQNDRAAELLSSVRPQWAAQLGQVDGWPLRPTVLVALAGVATTADPTAVQLFVADQPDGPLTATEAAFDVRLDESGQTLLIQPVVPLPAASRHVVLSLSTAVAEGASPLPTCGADGQPAPEYAQAQARLPAGVEASLALPFTLATTASELGRLYARLQSTPALSVESLDARTLDSFDDHSPPPEVAALLAPAAASGILSTPAYQDSSGLFQIDGEGVPTPNGTTEPGFVVALPAAGTPPYPFVLYQHGGTQQKENILPIAGPLAAAGFAVVGLDLPYHGDRAAPGGGTDMDILNFDAPLETRDNLRQAAADHLAVLTGIDALNAALEPVSGSGTTLDPNRAHYMGLSLGGVTGTMTFSAAADLAGAALFVGGGGYPEILSVGLFSIYVTDLLTHEEAERAALLGLVETLLDGADPLAYGSVESRGAPPRPVLFFEAIDDPVIANVATDQWARAFGAALAEPSQHEVPHAPSISLPAADNFAWSADGAGATRVLIQAPMAEIGVGERHGGLIRQPYSQELVAHCFGTLLSGGSCEVIDTGFAEH